MKKNPVEFQNRFLTTIDKHIRSSIIRVPHKLTFGNRMDASPPRQQICANDSDKNGKTDDTGPPSNDITNHINLPLCLVLGPEGDTRKQEWPVNWTTSVWMRSCQTSIMLELKNDEFCVFAEEVHRLNDFGFSVAFTLKDILSIYKPSEVCIKLKCYRNVPAGATISSKNHTAVLASLSLFPLTSCCLNAHSPKATGCVQTATFVGTCINLR